MYLRSIQLKNTGPIQDMNLVMPFAGDLPKPLVLVGRNGSGKSTLISFVVNALIGLKQQIYKDAEVEEGKDYMRVTPPLALKPGVAIDTYDDHRMAMCFSLVALGGVSVRILDPGCVAKTFPQYFDALKKITS